MNSYNETENELQRIADRNILYHFEQSISGLKADIQQGFEEQRKENKQDFARVHDRHDKLVQAQSDLAIDIANINGFIRSITGTVESQGKDIDDLKSKEGVRNRNMGYAVGASLGLGSSPIWLGKLYKFISNVWS